MKFRVWGQCIDCHFEGMLEYSHIEGEPYTEVEAVMLVQHCPACETTEHALIPYAYYEQMMEDVRAYQEALEE
jgi:hypothetical protein